MWRMNTNSVWCTVVRWWTVARWGGNSGHLISRSDEGFWWWHREMDYFMPMDECQRMKRFAWRREGIGVFWRETERRSKIFHPLGRWRGMQRGRECQEYWWLQAGQGACIWCWWRWRKEIWSLRMFSSRSWVRRRILVEHLMNVLMGGIFRPRTKLFTGQF